MTNQQITSAIESVMQDTNCDKLQAISALQAAAFKLGNNDLVDQLCEIKWAMLGEYGVEIEI